MNRLRNFQDTFETRKRSFISALSVCMTVPLKGLIFAVISFREISFGMDYFSWISHFFWQIRESCLIRLSSKINLREI